MKVKTVWLTVSILLGQFWFLLNGIAGEIVHTVDFDPSQLVVKQFQDYDQIALPNCELSFQPATPQLPVKSLHLELPAGAIIKELTITSIECNALEGTFQLWPVQKPLPLSLKSIHEFTEPDQQIYTRSNLYPDSPVQFTGQGNLGNATMANVLIYPVQYLPTLKQLIFNTRIKFQLTYELQQTELERHPSHFNKMKSFLADNSNVQSFTSSLEPGQYPYVIITNEKYMADFQPLADWKTKKGIRTRIITIQWLVQTYRQYSNYERIREFLRDAVEEWGTIWVLLGGDTNIIQHRKCWALDCQMGFDSAENDIPCDLYYADLDGDWNANQNRTYGEVDDEVDLYPDVFIGRAPAENSIEIQNFVNKLLAYEKSPDSDYILRFLFAAEILWNEPYTDQGISMDELIENIIPSRFQAIRRYQSLGNENSNTVKQEMKQGVGIFSHDGHCWYSIMSVGEGSLTLSDMDMLQNKDKYSVLFSIGCWPAAYDYDCIAEHFLTNPDGGGVAFVGNSRYGWGSPGNPGFGYSDRFHQTFLYYLFKENITHIGELLAQTKAKYVPYAREANVYRWCMYELNLLGDPEMPIWTDIPKELTAHYPKEIPSDTSTITITIFDEQQPLPNARICLMNESDVYQTGTTNQNGQAHFQVSTIHPDKKLTMTVTAQNFLPCEKEISFTTTSAYIAVAKMKINDNNSACTDSLSGPGETIKLDLTFKNYGSNPAKTLTAQLKANDSQVTISNDFAEIGDLSANEIKFIPEAFTVTFDSSLVDGDVVNFQLAVINEDTSWQHVLGISICEPLPRIAHISLIDSITGNGNGFAEAGETVEAIVWLENGGHAYALDPEISVECMDSGLTVEERVNNVRSLGPDSCLKIHPFNIRIADDLPGNPAPYSTHIIVHTRPKNGKITADTLLLTIGKTGIVADMENGAPDWSQTGSNDLWTLDSYRSHSGTTSWYCGDTSTRTYPPLLNQSLVSPPFYLAPNSQLSFWLWYDVALYSAWNEEGDGVHIELYVDNKWKQLDFIGTGGALNPVLMGNDWLPFYYDLSEYSSDKEMKLRFRFISDSEKEALEGVYLDDVNISVPEYGAEPEIEDPVTQLKQSRSLEKDFVISQNYPNPFNPLTTIKYHLGEKSQVKLRIYNLLGQNVRELVNVTQPAGTYAVIWDGKDDRGELASSGIYFYQISAGSFQQTSKMLLMK